MRKNTDLALLVIRLILAGILLSHGYQKLTGWAGALSFFESLSLPAPKLALIFAAVAEVGGGALILLGLWVETAASLVMIDMIGAIVFAVKGAAFDLGRGGMELTIFAMALALLLAGGGRYALGRKAAAL
jgi:putative oxidoreductase